MKRVLGLGLLLASFALPVLAGKNSQAFLLPWDVRVGDAQLPQGRCEVTWTETSGSQVQLTIKTADKKTTTVPARIVQGKHANVAVLAVKVSGVRHLEGFQTRDATLVVRDAQTEAK